MSPQLWCTQGIWKLTTFKTTTIGLDLLASHCSRGLLIPRYWNLCLPWWASHVYGQLIYRGLEKSQSVYHGIRAQFFCEYTCAARYRQRGRSLRALREGESTFLSPKNSCWRFRNNIFNVDRDIVKQAHKASESSVRLSGVSLP